MSLLKYHGVHLVLSTSVVIAALAASVSFSHPHVLMAKRVIAAEEARAPQPAALPAEHAGANPVIVELFTSEGCSSCPPADALLARLQQDQPVPSANIITLEEHVDYWDRLGWKDRFSSPSITRRQQNYQSAFGLDDVYTPQLIVNGSAQFDGTNPSAINAAIAKAAANTVPLHLTSVRVRYSSPVDIRYNLANPAGAQRQKVGIYAALIDPQADTNVLAGENAGHALHHVDIVRAIAMHEPTYMNQLAIWPGGIQLPAGSDPIGMRLVVFAQTKSYGPILGAVAHTITAKDIDPTAPPGARIPHPSVRSPELSPLL